MIKDIEQIMSERGLTTIDGHVYPCIFRKVLHVGNTRAVTLGKWIPADWKMVRVVLLSYGEEERQLCITRLA